MEINQLRSGLIWTKPDRMYHCFPSVDQGDVTRRFFCLVYAVGNLHNTLSVYDLAALLLDMFHYVQRMYELLLVASEYYSWEFTAFTDQR